MDLVENFAPLIRVEILIEPAQGDTDHVAMADLRTRLFLGNLEPEFVYSFKVLWPKLGRVLAENMELRLGGIFEDDLQRERKARRRQSFPLFLDRPGLLSGISEPQ